MDAVSATIAMADAQAKMGLHEDAISELRRAVRVHPKNSELHEKLGRLLFQRQKFEAALPHLQKAIRKKEDSGELHMLIGNCALSTGRSKVAMKSFEHCLAISYNPELALANVGRALIARRKAEIAWQRLFDAFVAGESTSKEIHSVLEMCAPLVSEQVPSLASEYVETSSISNINAPSGSIEAMAGIVQNEIVHKAIDLGMGLLDEEEENSENRLQIAMPGSGLDAPESRAEWSQPVENFGTQPQSDSWISSDHWDQVVSTQPTAQISPETEELIEQEIHNKEEDLASKLPFQVGSIPVQIEANEEINEPEIEDDVDLEIQDQVDEKVEEIAIQFQDIPLPGKPVISSEENALSQLARMPNKQRVWCWTTSYGEVPWGMELLKSRPDDRIEAAKAELTAWSKQNPSIWLAIDLQVEGRVPVNLDNVNQVIDGLMVPIILLIANQEKPNQWPLWGTIES